MLQQRIVPLCGGSGSIPGRVIHDTCYFPWGKEVMQFYRTFSFYHRSF